TSRSRPRTTPTTTASTSRSTTAGPGHGLDRRPPPDRRSERLCPTGRGSAGAAPAAQAAVPGDDPGADAAPQPAGDADRERREGPQGRGGARPRGRCTGDGRDAAGRVRAAIPGGTPFVTALRPLEGGGDEDRGARAGRQGLRVPRLFPFRLRPQQR